MISTPNPASTPSEIPFATSASPARPGDGLPTGAAVDTAMGPSTQSTVPRPSSTPVWGTNFAILDMPGAIALAEQVIRAGHPEYFVTANLNYLMLAEEHPRLDEINQRSIAVLADGFPIVQRSRFSVQPLPTRVAGADLIVELSRLAADRGYRIFFLGAAPGVARAAADRLVEKFPALQVAGCLSPPFGTITAADHQALLEEIRQTQPDILLVAFGQPKGECWIFDNLYELGIPLSVQLGASFDFLAGTARRAPVLWQRIGCEWLYRALTNPRRLVPRYVSNALFLARQLLHDITTSVKNWKFSST